MDSVSPRRYSTFPDLMCFRNLLLTIGVLPERQRALDQVRVGREHSIKCELYELTLRRDLDEREKDPKRNHNGNIE